MYFVYVIGNSSDIATENYGRCYIGVTNNQKLRWSAHVKSGYTVSEAITDNGWTFEENMKIIFSGDSESCFDMESKLRPMPLMGLNEAAGGKGGYTKYTLERNKKISDALKGKPKAVEHGIKISQAHKLTGNHNGSKNGMAAKWKFVDPSNNVFDVVGEFSKFCKDHNISAATLRNNIGIKIGPVSTKFRDNGNPNNLQKRINTIGWIVFKEN